MLQLAAASMAMPLPCLAPPTQEDLSQDAIGSSTDQLAKLERELAEKVGRRGVVESARRSRHAKRAQIQPRLRHRDRPPRCATT